jgi:hypothetical protein
MSSTASAAAAWYAVRNPLLKKPCSEKIPDLIFPANLRDLRIFDN